MRKRLPVIAMSLAMLGCPSEYGRHGRIEQALEDDLKPDSPNCPVGKHWGKLDPNCEGKDCKQDCIDDPPDVHQ
jgi:hypothetical protein